MIAPNQKKKRIPKCPICNQPLPYDIRDPNPPRYFPFCSEKCKLVDLHKWLSEEYYISSPVETREEEDEPASNQ
jgi:endogenous inhibitor of DNA gyrase (YacG/DUF329 family)